MILTNKQKMSAVVLVVAVAALFVDRVIIGSNASTPSRATAQTPADNSRPSQVGGGEARADLQRHSITLKPSGGNRLAAVASQQGVDPKNVHDAFAPHHAWAQPRRVGSSQAAGDPVQQFQKTYQLIALIKEDNVGFAIVNDRTLRIGQTIDGFRLVAVGKQSAIFESGDDHRVELKLISNN